MMVSCPKCGFTQPKDRYCASCGIDMLAFKPAEKPISQKLLSNWVVQVIVLAVVVAVAYSWIRNSNKIEERVADIDDAPNLRVIEEMERHVVDPRPPSPPAADRSGSDTSVSSSKQLPQGTGPGTASGAPGSASANGGAGGGAGNVARGLFRQTETTLGEPGAAGRTENATTVQRVRISFAEVQRQMVADLISNARNLASYGMQAGVIADLSARLKNAGRSMRALESAAEYPVRLNQPIVVFKGTRDEATGQNVGITLQIVPVALDENGLTMQLEVLRVLREPGGAPQVSEQNFQETFVTPKEGGAFLAVPLPRRPLTEEETRLYAGANVLRVLGSSTYQANNSDFLIFVEAR